MNEIEKYEFDRLGYIVIPGLLDATAVAQLAAAVDRLEQHALAHKDLPPRLTAPWGPEYHHNQEYGPFWMKSQNIATMEQDAYLLPATLARYSAEQRKLFYSRPEPRI
jgi:hypothetical protein